MKVNNTLHKLVQVSYNRLPWVFKVIRKLPLPEKLWRHLYFKGQLTISIDKHTSFEVYHYGYTIENDFYWNGFGKGWEATSLKLWMLFSERSESIFDIGSNTGVYALSAKAKKPNARVYAFEPVNRIYKRLKRNIDLNDMNIHAVEAGISSNTGAAILYDNQSEHMYSASLDQDMLAEDQGIVETKIKTYTLIDFLNEHDEKSVDLIKIDTEKHELEVLRGFGNLILSKMPVVLIEVLNRELGMLIEAFFPKNIYYFYDIIEGKGAKRVKRLGGNNGNYLICPHEIADSYGLPEYIDHKDL